MFSLLAYFNPIFLLSALVHSSPLLQQKGTVVSDLSGDGGGRSLYPGAARQMSYWWHLSICEMREPQRSSSLIHYCQPTLSSVLFLSLFSFELYLLIVLLPVKGIKGPAPPSASAQNSPIEIYSHTDEEDLSNDWQWEGLKGVWIISEAWLFWQLFWSVDFINFK